MSKFNPIRLAQRYAGFAGARAAAVLGRWMVLMQAVRHLDGKDFARLTAVLSAVEILRALADLGVESFAYARLGPPHRRLPATVRAAMRARLAASCVMALLAGGVGLLLGAGAATLPLFALVPVMALQASMFALLQKQAAMNRIGTLILSTAIGAAAAGTAAWLLRPSTAGTASLLLVSDCVALLAGLWLARRPLLALLSFDRLAVRTFRPALRRIRGVLSQNLVVSVLVMAYSRLDVLVVLPLCGLAVQGQYSSAFRAVEPAFLLLAIGSNALLAELGSRKSGDAHRLAGMISATPASLVLLILGAAAGALSLPGQWLLQLVPGLPPGAVPIGGWLIAAMPFRLVNSYMTAIIQRLGGFSRVMHAAILNAGLTFGICLVAVPAFGARGAALAVLLAEAVNTVFQLNVLNHRKARTGLRHPGLGGAIL